MSDYDKPKMFMPQVDWISDENDTVLVDYICRFENLKEDFRSVCKILKKDLSLPHLKASSRGDYRGYYDDQSIEIVAEWFEKDINLFGYTF